MMDSIKEFRFSKIRETLHYTKLRNGLEVFILPKEGYSKQFAVFATNFGSIDTRFTIPGEDEATSVPDGIAHFLEHKLFEEEKGNVFDKFSKLGASANAYTNFTNTAYLFSSTSNFYQSLEVLVKFVQNPYFTDQNVEKEKGIIGQEIIAKLFEVEKNMFGCCAFTDRYPEIEKMIEPIKNSNGMKIENVGLDDILLCLLRR